MLNVLNELRAISQNYNTENFKRLTFLKAKEISDCNSEGKRRSNTFAVSFNRGKTLRNIRTPINIEHIGSAIFQSKYCISRVEIITPTLPNVSASTCRNTPTTDERLVIT